MPDSKLNEFFSGDQSWLVNPIDAKTTRLIFRNRTDWNPSALNNLLWRGVLADFVRDGAPDAA